MKVLRSRKRSSLAPILENSLSTTPIFAESAGTKDPTCAKMTVSAVCRSSVDFPAIFGPVIMCIFEESDISTEFGTNWRPEARSPISTVGWRPLTMTYDPLWKVSYHIRKIVGHRSLVSHLRLYKRHFVGQSRERHYYVKLVYDLGILLQLVGIFYDLCRQCLAAERIVEKFSGNAYFTTQRIKNEFFCSHYCRGCVHNAIS